MQDAFKSSQMKLFDDVWLKCCHNFCRVFIGMDGKIDRLREV